MFELENLITVDNNLTGPASLTVARAFMDDPETVYLMPDKKKRENLRYAMEYFLKVAVLGHEKAFTTSVNCEGVALWAHSEQKMPFWAVLKINPFPALRCGWRFISHQLEANNMAADIKKKYAPPRHMYLALLGVDPSYQGKGFASALIKPMLQKLDESHLPAYLETQNIKNVKMYEHFGFKLVYQSEYAEGHCHLYAMLREPVKL